MPKLPRVPTIALAVGGAALTAALVIPTTRRQAIRSARTFVDELALRAGGDFGGRLLLLTTEGRQSRFPRTVVLAGVDHDGETYVMPWMGRPGWLANLESNPDVVVDDRTKVRRARAEVVDGELAARVRETALAALPPPVTAAIEAVGWALPQGAPAIRFTTR